MFRPGDEHPIVTNIGSGLWEASSERARGLFTNEYAESCSLLRSRVRAEPIVWDLRGEGKRGPQERPLVIKLASIGSQARTQQRWLAHM
jgi:hypothetical protein